MPKNNGIYQRNGRYYIDIRAPSGKRIRRSLGTKDRQEAQELRDKIAHELWQQQRMGVKAKRTWDEAVVRWLEEMADKKSLSTDISRLRQLGKLRGQYLDELTRDSIMDIINTMPNGRSTKNRYIALIRSILYKAQNEWEWLDKIPKLKQYKEPTKRVRWLKPVEAERLIQALPDNFWRQMAIFSLATGLRQNNVFMLKWEQINLERKIAWIYPDNTKSGKAIGVPLNGQAERILRERIGIHTVYVFTNSYNNPVSSLDKRVWQRALNDAGIRDFKWHDLRHTWASWLVQRGVPLLALKEMGGWEKLDMVMRYAHLATEHLLEHANTLDCLDSLGHKIDTNPKEHKKEKNLNS